MNHKDILKLRGVRDTFKDLSIEHWSYYTDVDDAELKVFHKGKSYAYDVAAERIDGLIIESKKDISKEQTIMDKKEILIESAKYIAEHCAEHDECNENCAFYMKHGGNVCFFDFNSDPCEWDFETIEEN